MRLQSKEKIIYYVIELLVIRLLYTTMNLTLGLSSSQFSLGQVMIYSLDVYRLITVLLSKDSDQFEENFYLKALNIRDRTFPKSPFCLT